ncbi:hypothetical protein QLX08_005729, partial [Tetragonisca angustula]
RSQVLVLRSGSGPSNANVGVANDFHPVAYFGELFSQKVRENTSTVVEIVVEEKKLQ